MHSSALHREAIVSIRPVASIMSLLLIAVACGGDTVDEPDANTTSSTALGAGPYAVADLSVQYTHPDRSLSYRITCQGDTANLIGDPLEITAEQACVALAQPEIAQRLIDGPPEGQACTEIYGGPDVAEISGTLDGAAVQTTVDRTNGCGINDWDVLLSAILPSAIGATE